MLDSMYGILTIEEAHAMDTYWRSSRPQHSHGFDDMGCSTQLAIEAGHRDAGMLLSHAHVLNLAHSPQVAL